MNNIFKPKFYVVLKQGYNWKLFQKDLFSGFIVGIVALPMVVAFSVAAGVSPERGLVTAAAGGLIIALFGGSRFQIGGPTAAFIVVAYGIIQKYGFDGLMISTLIAGVLLAIFGFLRLGSVIKLIPHPLIVGFTSGIALLIFTYIFKDALGLPVHVLLTTFSHTWLTYFSGLKLINWYALIITLTTILLVILSGKIFTKLPGYLFAVLIVTIITHVFNLPVPTVYSHFGQITNSWDFHFPVFEWNRFDEFIQPALTIAVLCSIQSLLSAVVADGMTSSNHRSNTELIAQGIANIVSPCLGGIPVSGAVVRTVSNIKNGARTPFSGIIHSFVIILFIVFAIKWTGYIPLSCLAGLIIVFAWNLGNWRSFVSILKGSKYDILVLLTAFFLTVFVNLATAERRD